MISVLVVEDEIPILRSICRQVESANSSFMLREQLSMEKKQ